MSVRTFSCLNLLAVLVFFAQSLCAAPVALSSGEAMMCREISKTTEIEHENGCPPVVNIQAEFLPSGKALLSWDAIPGVPKYMVKVVDENQTLVLDTIVNDNKLLVNGLQQGMGYEITVCYHCQPSGELICSNKTLRYIIIDELIVMLDGNPCSCKKNVETEGTCRSSASDYYSLLSSRVYNISLADEQQTKLSFVVDQGSVSIVGNCEMDFNGLSHEPHGEANLDLPYYDLGSSKIHFHGTRFCVSGEPVSAITYCDLSTTGKTKERQGMQERAAGVYPNPFTNLLYVELKGAKNGVNSANIQLYDATGQLVLEQNASELPNHDSSIQIHTSTLKAGFYWLTLTQGEFRTSKRVIKMD